MIRSLLILAALTAVACSQGSKEKTTPKPNLKNPLIKPVDAAACTGVSPKSLDGTWEAVTFTEDGSVVGKQVLNFNAGMLTSTTLCKSASKTANLTVKSAVKVEPAYFDVLQAEEKVEQMTADVQCKATLGQYRIGYKFSGKCLTFIGQQGIPDVTFTPVMKELMIKPIDPAVCAGNAPKNLEGTWEAMTVTDDGVATGKQVLNFKAGVLTSTTICQAPSKSITLSVKSSVKIDPAFIDVLQADQKVEQLTPEIQCKAVLGQYKVGYKYQGKCLTILGQQGLPDTLFTPVTATRTSDSLDLEPANP